MNVADALSGNAGLEGIQQMLFSGAPHMALRRALGELLATPHRLGPCQLRRARFKSGRKLMAYYDAHVHLDGNGRESIHPVFVTWNTHLDGTRHHPLADLAAIEDEAARRGLLAPFRKLATDIPELRMHVRVSPFDVRFPQLVRVCDPKYVRTMIASACGASGATAPASEYSIAFIRYRPGKRHVLRYDPLDTPERRAMFAKLDHKSEDGARTLHRAKQIWEWLAEHGEGAGSIRPLASVTEDSVVLYAQVVGTPLSESLGRPGQSLASPLKGTGAALSALHQFPQALAGPLKSHDFVEEVKKIARASQHFSALLPSVGETIKAVLERARELYERLPLEPPSFTHGDFRASHVWITAEGPTLIDFDSCHSGDPALDVGKFLADLRFRCTVYGRHERKQAQDQFLGGYRPGAPAERLVRARLYEVIELVNHTVCRLHMFEENWARKTGQLVGCAQAALSDLQLSLGSSVK